MNFIKKNKLFIIIFFIGLLFRVVKLPEYFIYSHELDLQGWIIRDIIVNHHPRLIGQETSITGLFIGPAYYYLLAIFFALFNLEPLASYIPITIISLSTLISVYFIGKKLYNKNIAITAAFIYAISPSIVFLDRWVVPTQTTLLWTVWFYYIVISFSRGNIKPLPVLIVLLGFIWHIHIAFVPLLLLIPVAIKLSKINILKEIKKINKKYFVFSICFTIFLMTPFFTFELRHGFQQVKGVFSINYFREGQAFETRVGFEKFQAISNYVSNVVWSPITGNDNLNISILLPIFLLIPIYLLKKNKSNVKETILIYLWFLITFSFQIFNKRIISQYYFNNLIILSIFIFTQLINSLKTNSINNKSIYFIGILITLCYFNQIITKPTLSSEYIDKTNIAEYIGNTVKKSGYKCIGINFIGDIPIRYGYRSLLYKNGVTLISPGNDVPVFSIVEPQSISITEIEYSSGNIGVIPPHETNSINENSCNNKDRQLAPLNGFN